MESWYKLRTFAVHVDTVAGWIDAKEGFEPSADIVKGGEEATKEPLYVGRAMHEADVVPGKFSMKNKAFFIGYHGEEYEKKEWQMLYVYPPVELGWMKARDGHIPSGAVQTGLSAKGEPLFTARHEHEGSLVVGKLHPSLAKCFVPYAGKQHEYSEYEVLCVNYTPTK